VEKEPQKPFLEKIEVDHLFQNEIWDIFNVLGEMLAPFKKKLF